MKKINLLLFSSMLAVWTALPVLAAEPAAKTTPAVVAPAGGGLGARDGQGQGSDVETTVQQTMFETGKDSRNDLKDQMKALDEQNKQKKAQRDFIAQQRKSQAAAKAALKRGASPALAPVPAPAGTPLPGMRTLDSGYLNLQGQEQEGEKRYDTLKKSSETRHDTDKNSISNVR